MAFESVQDYTLSSVLPISQPGFASNAKRVQDSETDASDSLPTSTPVSQSAKRPEPVSEADAESDSPGDEEESSSTERPASTRADPESKPTKPKPPKNVAERLADGETETRSTHTVGKPTAQAKRSKPTIQDNMFFRVARILLAVVVVMAVLYLVYWVATHVYGVDVFGWARGLGDDGVSGLSASPSSAEPASMTQAEAPPLLAQGSSSASAPEVGTPSSDHTADVDSSASSSLFKSIGAWFGASGTAAAATAAASAGTPPASAAPSQSPPSFSLSATHPTATAPASVQTLPPHVSPYHPYPQAPHVPQAPAAQAAYPRPDHVTIHQGSGPSAYDQSIPLDNRRADELLDMLARIE